MKRQTFGVVREVEAEAGCQYVENVYWDKSYSMSIAGSNTRSKHKQSTSHKDNPS